MVSMGMGKMVVEFFSAADLDQGLQVTELQGSRVTADHVGGIGQASRGFEFTFGVDDFRATFAFRFSLACDGPLHFLRQGPRSSLPPR